MKWPKTVGDMKLYEGADGYAFYFRERGFGFADAIQIDECESLKTPGKRVTVVKHMSGNSWGRIERDMRDSYTDAELEDIYHVAEKPEHDPDGFERYYRPEGENVFVRGQGAGEVVWVSKWEPRTTEKPYTLHYLICRHDYFPTTRRALDSLMGKTEVPKGKRKPRPIEPMTEEELEEWCK